MKEAHADFPYTFRDAWRVVRNQHGRPVTAQPALTHFVTAPAINSAGTAECTTKGRLAVEVMRKLYLFDRFKVGHALAESNRATTP
jgi:hypothetical protein